MLVAKAFSEQAASSKSIRQTEAYSGDDGSPRVGGLLGLKFWQQGRAELLLRLRQFLEYQADVARHRFGIVCITCVSSLLINGSMQGRAAIEDEIAHLRSLALDALRRHWRVIFGRTPPADLSKDLLGQTPRYARETCSSSRSAGATAGSGSDDGLPVFEDDRCGRRLVKRSR